MKEVKEIYIRFSKEWESEAIQRDAIPLNHTNELASVHANNS